ncbi:helix-turn-helix domain-containing protein [Agaribacter marinus]|nr:helix-turn-helix domain-containing protein [Agaribacter marinus]
MSTPKKVVVLAYPNLCLFEFSCAMEVFAQRRPEFEVQHYSTVVCATDDSHQVGLPIENLVLSTTKGLSDIHDADLVIIPGWQGPDILPSDALRNSLLSAYNNGARIASICSGVFLLAYTGLLANKVATTHWQYIAKAREKFPNTHFDENVLYTDNGQILTSAGSAAGLDMCLHLVKQDYGQHVANAYARRLVIPPYREGGQAQFIQQPIPKSDNNTKLSVLLDTLENNLSSQYSVEDMADMVNMSERNFLRQFKAQFATSPAKWLINLRIKRACELLETSELPTKSIAQMCGLGTEESLRHHFRRQLKVSPLHYRRQFSEL